MQRAAWTDERLDDMSERMDAGFERVEGDIRDLRREVGGEFRSLRGEIGAVRGEMASGFAAARGEVASEFAAVRGEISELRTLVWRLNGGVFVAVVAAILLRGI